MRSDEAESMIFATFFFMVIGLMFVAAFRIAEGLVKLLIWGTPRLIRTWKRHPDACNSVLSGTIVAITCWYASRYNEHTAEWFQLMPWLLALIAVIAAATTMLMLNKIKSVRFQKAENQTEFFSLDGNGSKIVEVKHLKGVVSPAVNAELRSTGLNRVIREAKKVSWADRIILASNPPRYGKFGDRLSAREPTQNLARIKRG